MNTVQNVTPNAEICQTHFCGMKCISWSAIVIGALVAFGLSFLLYLFSAAIGLSIYKVSPEGISKLAVGGMLGFAIGVIVSMFFAGWVAGYFGRAHCEKKYCGAVYGFGSWCLALILMIVLTMPFTRFVANYTNYLTHTVVTTTTPDITTARNQSSTTTSMTMPSEQTANDLGKGAFVLFLMFFLGAIASTCGGHAGVHSCKNCCQKGGCGCSCNKTKV